MTGWKDTSIYGQCPGTKVPHRWEIEVGWLRVMFWRRVGEKTYATSSLQYASTMGIESESEDEAKIEALEGVRAECVTVIQEIDQLLNEPKAREKEN